MTDEMSKFNVFPNFIFRNDEPATFPIWRAHRDYTDDESSFDEDTEGEVDEWDDDEGKEE